MSMFIQVGLTAMRDPTTGEPLEAVPLYVEVKDEKVPELLEIDRKELAAEILSGIAEGINDNMPMIDHLGVNA